MPADYNRWYANDPQGGTRYFNYVVEELPKVCQTLFTLHGKMEDTFIGGLSMGMQGASKCAVLKPEQYAVALLMSWIAMSAQRYIDRWKNYQKGIQTSGGSDTVFSAIGDPCSIAGTDDDTCYNTRKQTEVGSEMPKFFMTSGSEAPNKLGTLQTYHFSGSWVSMPFMKK